MVPRTGTGYPHEGPSVVLDLGVVIFVPEIDLAHVERGALLNDY